MVNLSFLNIESSLLIPVMVSIVIVVIFVCNSSTESQKWPQIVMWLDLTRSYFGIILVDSHWCSDSSLMIPQRNLKSAAVWSQIQSNILSYKLSFRFSNRSLIVIECFLLIVECLFSFCIYYNIYSTIILEIVIITGDWKEVYNYVN